MIPLLKESPITKQRAYNWFQWTKNLILVDPFHKRWLHCWFWWQGRKQYLLLSPLVLMMKPPGYIVKDRITGTRIQKHYFRSIKTIFKANKKYFKGRIFLSSCLKKCNEQRDAYNMSFEMLLNVLNNFRYSGYQNTSYFSLVVWFIYRFGNQKLNRMGWKAI